MAIFNVLTGADVAGMAQTLHVTPAVAAAAHPAAAAITPPRKHRTASAIVASVNRGIT
jgi:hypothetical protein